MARRWTRRELLQASAGAALGVVGGAARKSVAVESASRRLGHADDAEIERLAERIVAAEPDRVVDLVAAELENGLSRQRLHAANFIAGIRYRGHHYAYVAHPVNVVSNAVSARETLLPIFYHVGALKDQTPQPRLRNIDKANLPANGKAEEFFRAAMDESDHEAASRSFLALAREFGPRSAYDRLWLYGAERNHRSGGHTAISVVNTFRTLQAIDWRCPETVLQFAVEDSAVGVAGGGDLPQVNRIRSSRVAEAPSNWHATKSDHKAVLELVALYRQGNPEEACETTFNWLREGKIQAGTIWDAVFLTSAELVTRYTWVGSKMLAGHSITCTNALHFIFRNVGDPATRLYAILEAVEWTTSFLNRERARPALRDRDILAITPADLPADEDLEAVFATIPIRRRSQFSPALLPEADQAQELAFAWAVRNSDQTHFFRRALELLCAKSTTEVHDFKFPLALFENYRYASPEWRPHLLAASVHVLHGTQVEDGPVVAQARQRLGL